MQRGMLRGLVVFRWGAWFWIAVAMVLNRNELERPVAGWGLVGLVLAWTVVTTALALRSPADLERTLVLLTELAIGAALGLAGGVVFELADNVDEAFSSVRTIGFAWPLAGIISAGVVWGAWRGLASGIAVASTRWFAPVLGGIGFGEFEGSHFFSLLSTTLLYALTGAVSGYMASLLRRAEKQIAAAQAREEVARTLHDGVLQTLAVIERRADDPELARLAREQDRELREFLFGSGTGADGRAAELGARLRAAAARFEDTFGGRVDVVVAPDLPALGPDRSHALAGAVGEALVNAGKHGGATVVTVYLEPDEAAGVHCSVRDNGRGFEPATITEGVGLSRSIRGRMTDFGGRAEIDSRPGAGTEVRLWLP